MPEQQPRETQDARILVVDDEPTLLEAVRYNLQREGFGVEVATDGWQAVEAVRASPPDLIVLDVMLPGIDGFQVCRTLRAESTVPILLLSARGEAFDRILGLELGADDYLTKPFAMRELLARVRAMLRRARMATPQPAGGTPAAGTGAPSDGVHAPRVGVGETPADNRNAPLAAGDLSIDPARRRAYLAGDALLLKPKEFDLLLYLMRHPGIVISREALLREVWDYDYPVDTRTVDVHIRWLRQKIEGDPSQPRRIETVRGYGYRFVAVVD